MRACHGPACRGSRAAPGTGLSGGALPSPKGVLIVLSRMRRILSVDLPTTSASWSSRA